MGKSQDTAVLCEDIWQWNMLEFLIMWGEVAGSKYVVWHGTHNVTNSLSILCLFIYIYIYTSRFSKNKMCPIKNQMIQAEFSASKTYALKNSLVNLSNKCA